MNSQYERYIVQFPVEWHDPIREHLRDVALLRNTMLNLTVSFDIDEQEEGDDAAEETLNLVTCNNDALYCIGSFPSKVWAEGSYIRSDNGSLSRYDLPSDKYKKEEQYRWTSDRNRLIGPFYIGRITVWKLKDKYCRNKYPYHVTISVCSYDSQCKANQFDPKSFITVE